MDPYCVENITITEKVLFGKNLHKSKRKSEQNTIVSFILTLSLNHRRCNYFLCSLFITISRLREFVDEIPPSLYACVMSCPLKDEIRGVEN